MAILLPVAMPFYLVRFSIGGLPSTFLEVYLGIFFLVFTVTYRFSGWKLAGERMGGWRPWLILWLATSLLAAFVAPSLWTGLGLWRAYILEPVLVFATLFVVVHEEEVRRRIVWMLFATLWGVVVWAIVQFITGKGIPHPWNVAITAGRRATGPYLYPNALALFVTPIAAFAFAEWIKRPRFFFALLTAIGGLLGILLAKSDGGLIALCAAVIAVLCSKRWGRLLVAVGAVLWVVGLVAMPGLRTSIWHELTFKGWSGQVRLFIWRESWQMLKDHWIFGAGLGGYPTVFNVYHKARAIEIFQYPHTILFNFWTETGLLGLITFAGIIFYWVKQVWKKNAERLLSLAPLIAILVHGLVDVPYFKNDLAIVFWMLVFLTTHVLHRNSLDAQKID